MSLLSKSEIQFLQGQKDIAKSYEYKLKSVIKRKLSILLEKELPLLLKLYPDCDLATISSKINREDQKNLTKFSKKKVDSYNNSDIKGDKDVSGQPKLVAREGLEGSNHSSHSCISQKTTENSNFSIKIREDQRRERDSNSVVILEETIRL